MSEPFNQHAADVINGTIDLIERVLIKHSAAVLEEMHDQIVSRNDRISALEQNVKANEELYNAIQRELETARTIAHRAEHRANQAESERDALIGDKDEYCEILRILGMEEEGSAVGEIDRLARAEENLRYLLRIEYLRHNVIESPWTCAEADCPRFGKSVLMTGCNCKLDFEMAHIAEIKKEIGL